MRPLILAANQPAQFYRGGAAIARLRGVSAAGERRPEDWVASTTTLFGQAEAGLSVLPDGRLLRSAIEADPVGFLGPEHLAAYGPDPALLVKLLDAAERLPVHAHPSRQFASRRLGCRFGKTEAWLVLGASGERPEVFLGFSQQVEREQLDVWAKAQRVDELLGAMNRLPVRAGDAVLVPAGLPHAIGAGVFVLELQEPTDFSVNLEWERFGLAGDPQLGLPAEVAFDCVDSAALAGSALERLVTRRADAAHAGVKRLFPVEADPYFRAERVRPDGSPVNSSPSFAVLVVTDGHGTLRSSDGDRLELRRGQTALVPYAAGVTTLDGDVDLIRCLPPKPEHAAGQAGASA